MERDSRTTNTSEMLGARIREARLRADISQDDMAVLLDVSQPTYFRIESGARPLKGDELVMIADRLGVRSAALTGLSTLRQRARFAARADGADTSLDALRHRLEEYLELDAYLAGHGIAAG
ncbi:helix-turn-helix transcriptional regulator [Brachybacterium sp. J144]|uniref:helix-turn-helix domain-containing protein n=1 Tax=Brachybacterium sp. J144 TaxID=3116487 RepID=UPI002E77F4CA|nr:helix-turn-helix transcriptional regulator [Brachybacterium sp. J144]MEE1650487.1 helix-turn-helix transcriptional regulator [Brachybacterium sp. J144]